MRDALQEIYNKPLLIVCDTCVYAGDFTLSNAIWKKIKSMLVNHPKAYLVLPECVELEVIKKIVDMGLEEVGYLEARMDKFRVRELARFIDLEEMKTGLGKYAAEYIEKILVPWADRKIKRTEFPKSNAKTYYLRAVELKKPHKSKDGGGGYRKAVNGFRDAVVWESIKEIYRDSKNSNILFVTWNSSDFSSEELASLHPDFTAEIEGIKVTGSKLHYIADESSVSDFLNKVEFTEKVTVASEALVLKAFNNCNSDQLYKAIHATDEFDRSDFDSVSIDYAEVDSVSIETYYPGEGPNIYLYRS